MNEKDNIKKISIQEEPGEALDTLLKRICPLRNWLILVTLCLLVLLLLLWGIFGRIEIKTDGMGIMIKSNALFVVKTLRSGKITSINVQEGDYVKQGQILAWVESTELFAQVKETRNKITVLKEMLAKKENNNNDMINITREEASSKGKNYERNIQYLSDDIQWYKRMLEDYTILAKKGAIPKVDVHPMYTSFEQSKLSKIKFEDELKMLDFNVPKMKVALEKDNEDIAIEIIKLENHLASLYDKLRTYNKIISPVSGQVLEISVNEGMFVPNNEGIFLIMHDSLGKIIKAVVCFSPYEGKKVKQGMEARLIPTIYKKEKFGYIRGIVTDVGEYPSDKTDMLRMLGNKDVVNLLAKKDNASIIAIIQLTPDNNTSGYSWTSSDGPPEPLQIGTLCKVEVTTEIETPLTLCIEGFKKYILDIGDIDKAE